MYEENTNLKDFLIDSYLNQCNEIVEIRLRDLEINISNLSNLNNDYQKQIDNLQNDIFSYPEYISKINEYRVLIKELNDDYELSESDLHKRQRDLKDKYIVLSKMVGDYYQKFLWKFEACLDINNIMDYLDDLITILNNKIYFIAIDASPIRRDIDRLIEELDNKFTLKKQKERIYSDESLQLVYTLMYSIKDKINKKIDKNNKQISEYDSYKLELSNTLCDIINKNKSRIERLINEGLFESLSRDEIINKVNNIIDEVKNLLKTKKSYEQETREQEIIKQDIINKLESLQSQYDEYIYNQALYKQYEQKLNEYNTKLKPINDFNFQYKHLINQSDEYSKIYQTYVYYLTEINNNQQALDDLETKYNEALREKNNLSFKPIESVEQELLNNQKLIRNIEEDKTNLVKKQKELKKSLSDFENDIDNKKFINLYNKINIITNNSDKLLKGLETVQNALEKAWTKQNSLQADYDEYLRLQEELKKYNLI